MVANSTLKPLPRRCEVDNVTYAIGLAEHLRANVEKNGRVTVDSQEAKALVRTKIIHVCLITIGLLLAVPVLGSGDVLTYQRGYLVPAFFIALAGGVEACCASGEQDQTPLAVLMRTTKMFCSFFLGFIITFMMIQLQFGSRSQRV